MNWDGFQSISCTYPNLCWVFTEFPASTLTSPVRRYAVRGKRTHLYYLWITKYLCVCVCCLQLKEMFPGFRLSLPPKRWFKDNYDTDFLEDRQLGLQAFLQNLVAHKDIANWWADRHDCFKFQFTPSACWNVHTCSSTFITHCVLYLSSNTI